MAAPYPKLAEVRKRYKLNKSYQCTHCGDKVPANVTHAHVNQLFEKIAELETELETKLEERNITFIECSVCAELYGNHTKDCMFYTEENS